MERKLYKLLERRHQAEFEMLTPMGEMGWVPTLDKFGIKEWSHESGRVVSHDEALREWIDKEEPISAVFEVQVS